MNKSWVSVLKLPHDILTDCSTYRLQQMFLWSTFWLSFGGLMRLIMYLYEYAFHVYSCLAIIYVHSIRKNVLKIRLKKWIKLQ